MSPKSVRLTWLDRERETNDISQYNTLTNMKWCICVVSFYILTCQVTLYVSSEFEVH